MFGGYYGAAQFGGSVGDDATVLLPFDPPALTATIYTGDAVTAQVMFGAPAAATFDEQTGTIRIFVGQPGTLGGFDNPN